MPFKPLLKFQGRNLSNSQRQCNKSVKLILTRLKFNPSWTDWECFSTTTELKSNFRTNKPAPCKGECLQCASLDWRMLSPTQACPTILISRERCGKVPFPLTCPYTTLHKSRPKRYKKGCSNIRTNATLNLFRFLHGNYRNWICAWIQLQHVSNTTLHIPTFSHLEHCSRSFKTIQNFVHKNNTNFQATSFMQFFYYA